MCQVNTINVLTVLSNVFPCSPLHLATSFDIARVFAIEGTFTKEQEKAIKAYYINPVDSREASLELPTVY